MNDLDRALAKGMHPDLLEAAAHEAGHGVVWVVAGIKVDKLVARLTFFGDQEGYATPKQQQMPDRVFPGYLVGLRAGQAAQYRFLRRYLGHSPHDAAKQAERGGQGDMKFFRAESEGVLSASTALDRAFELVERHGDRIDRATLKLARAGRLSGGAL